MCYVLVEGQCFVNMQAGVWYVCVTELKIVCLTQDRQCMYNVILWLIIVAIISVESDCVPSCLSYPEIFYTVIAGKSVSTTICHIIS
jgi:hypothetical protein